MVATCGIGSEGFWDIEALRAELLRVSEICHGCRQCSELCGSFRVLFHSIDETHGGRVSRLTDVELAEVVDLCYQCKLCLLGCPHGAAEGRMPLIDFPRLMLREKLVRTRRNGVRTRDRLLGNRDLTGAIGGLTAPLSNWLARRRPVRLAMERALGIDRNRPLPLYHRRTFERWFRKREKRLQRKVAGSGGKVVLFHTCSVNYNNPAIGRSVVAVLTHHDIRIECPDQRCCGMAALERGDLDGALENLRFNVRTLRRFVDNGYTVIALQPTCSDFLRSESRWLDAGEDVRIVSEATRDVCEYLLDLHRQGTLDRSFVSAPGKVLYHVPCRLTAQGIGFASQELLEQIPGIELEVLEGCAGRGTVQGLNGEFLDASTEAARRFLARIETSEPDRIASDCARAGLEIRQVTGREVLHPVEILCDAYGLSHRV